MKNDKATIMKQLLERASNVADQAEVFSLDSENISIGYRNGVLREMKESQDAGICLRIIKDKRIAQVTTSNLDKALETVDQALDLVPYGEKVTFSFSKPGVCESIETPKPPERNFDILVEQSGEIIKMLRNYDRSIMANAGSDLDTINVRLMNSNGVDTGYERHTQTVAAVAVQAEEGNILTAYRLYMGQKQCPNPTELAEQVIELMTMGNKNVPFEGGSIPLLFTPHALADIFAAFGAGINGYAVSKGMSPLTGKIGKQLLHKNISIIDDGLHPFATGSQMIDDEGVPCRKNYLVENGVLKNYLLDLSSASKLDMQPTGNGFRFTPLIKSRSYAATPAPAFTNLFLPPGERSYKDLLQSADRILLIDQLTGVLLGNLINGDWSGNIEYGILFEHGKPSGRIKDAMTGGNFYNMFKRYYAESSAEREWVSGFGGGAGSSYFPYVLFDGMNVSA
jgi:PmbA protein